MWPSLNPAGIANPKLRFGQMLGSPRLYTALEAAAARAQPTFPPLPMTKRPTAIQPDNATRYSATRLMDRCGNAYSGSWSAAGCCGIAAGLLALCLNSLGENGYPKSRAGVLGKAWS